MNVSSLADTCDLAVIATVHDCLVGHDNTAPIIQTNKFKLHGFYPPFHCAGWASPKGDEPILVTQHLLAVGLAERRVGAPFAAPSAGEGADLFENQVTILFDFQHFGNHAEVGDKGTDLEIVHGVLLSAAMQR